MARPRSTEVRESTVSIRVSDREREDLERRAKVGGHRSVSAYLRALAQADRHAEETATPAARPLGQISAFHRTPLGTIWSGDALDWMAQAEPGSVNLIVTSPPFGLLRVVSALCRRIPARPGR